MILHPGILALLLGSAITLVMCLQAARLGLEVLAHWDPTRSDERQLMLERKTDLISTLMSYALGFQIVAGLLYLYTLEDLHRLFIGAMCATGTLNANEIGWMVLLLKIVLFFGAAFWVHFNQLDLRTEDTPLMRAKFRTLLALVPLLGLDLYLQVAYFSGLNPEIITSCCGSLFRLGNTGVASDLAGQPPGQTMVVFFSLATVQLVLIGFCLRKRTAIGRYLLFVSTAFFFLATLVAVVSFISPYIYQMPTHHCPFDMLQHHYNYIGYPFYIALFTGVFFGLLPGLSLPGVRIASLRPVIERFEHRWLWISLVAHLIVLLIVLWPILFSPFKLFGGAFG